MTYFVKHATGKKRQPWMPQHLPEASAYSERALAEQRILLAREAFDIDLSSVEHDLRQRGIALKDGLLAYIQLASAEYERMIETRYAQLSEQVLQSGKPTPVALQRFMTAVKAMMTAE